jgi:hypothetical protein
MKKAAETKRWPMRERGRPDNGANSLRWTAVAKP